MRVLCIITNDGNIFYSREFSEPLVAALERQCIKRHRGAQQMTLVEMTEEQYQAIPATNQSADLFSVDY